MDNKLNEIRRKIRFLRAEMLGAEDNIRKQVNRDEDCSEAAVHLMAMRVVMLGLISERNRLGGEERLLNVDERLKLDVRAAGRKPSNGGKRVFQRKPAADLIRDGGRFAPRKRDQAKIRSLVPLQPERKRPEAAVSDETIEALRRRIAELDQLARRLNQSGLDSARAQLLLSRKRAELEDFINRGQRCQHRFDGTTTTRITRHG
jgi:hypothetical protein